MLYFLQNTFQIVLATDGESSYTLFLYSDILWSQADFRNVDNSGGSGNSAESGSGGSGNSTGGGGSESDVGSGLIRYIDFGNVRYVALCSIYCCMSLECNLKAVARCCFIVSPHSGTFAQAGLVNGSNFYILDGSRTANITLLNSTSNIGQEGVWLFRISDFLPASKSCT